MGIWSKFNDTKKMFLITKQRNRIILQENLDKELNDIWSQFENLENYNQFYAMGQIS